MKQVMRRKIASSTTVSCPLPSNLFGVTCGVSTLSRRKSKVGRIPQNEERPSYIAAIYTSLHVGIMAVSTLQPWGRHRRHHRRFYCSGVASSNCSRRANVGVACSAYAVAAEDCAVLTHSPCPAKESEFPAKMKREHISEQNVAAWKRLNFPITQLLPEISNGMSKHQHLVIQAPTGAGKTTIVPLEFLERLDIEGRILILQPRRLSCINIARRMANLLGEEVGQTVGYRIRHEVVIGNLTRIEVITEGILVRMLQENPFLEGVSCIFFDEFHERSLDSDLSFTLCLAALRSRCLKVRFIVMSATLGDLGQEIVELIDDAGLIIGEGKSFPVTVSHRGLLNLSNYEPRGPRDFAAKVAGAVADAMDKHPGDVLVFLPGEREIMYVWIALNNMGIGDGNIPKNLVAWARKLIDKSAVDLQKRVQVSVLYSTLEIHEQDECLAPPPDGWRKVILATSIAESSLTVPGVRIVIDTGLRRLKVEEPDTCMSYMRTVPVSLAAADQRKGRAGRTCAGVCWRLWSEEQHATLHARDTPEIHRTDLSSCVLQLGVAGYLSDKTIAALPWVDPPHLKDLGVGREVLERFCAFEKAPSGGWLLTQRGKEMARFPLHPRMGHMILQARAVSSTFTRDACDLAAMLEERELLRGGRVQHGIDLEARLDALQNPNTSNVLHTVRERVLRASEQIQSIANLSQVSAGQVQQAWQRRSVCVLVAWAFPELCAEAIRKQAPRGNRNSQVFRMFNGCDAAVDNRDALAKSPRLAVASLAGSKVFWAVKATSEVFTTFGIDITDPVNHQVFGSTIQLEGQIPLAVARYLVDKNCDNLMSHEALVQFMSHSSSNFPPSDIIAMVRDVADAKDPDEGLLCSLAEKIVLPRIEDFTASQIAEVACTLAAVGVDAPTVFSCMSDHLHSRLDELPLDSDSGNLSSLLWAYTTAGMLDEKLCRSMTEIAVRAFVDFKPLVLSNVREICFWSFNRASMNTWVRLQKRDAEFRPGRKGFADSSFYEMLASFIVPRLHEVHPISCVYLMWSFSKANIRHDELFDAVASRVGEEPMHLDRCGLTMFCWNYSFIHAPNSYVYDIVAQDLLRQERMAEMAPRDIAGVAWAFAEAGVCNKQMFDALIFQATGQLQDGLAQRCYRRPYKSLARDVYKGDHSAVEGAVDAFDVFTLKDVLLACVKFNIRTPQFFDLAVEYLELGLRESRRKDRILVKPAMLIRTLDACARLGISDTGLFEAAIPHIIEELNGLEMDDLVSLVCSWAVSGPHNRWYLATLGDTVRRRAAHGDFTCLSPADAKSFAWGLHQLGLSNQE